MDIKIKGDEPSVPDGASHFLLKLLSMSLCVCYMVREQFVQIGSILWVLRNNVFVSLGLYPLSQLTSPHFVLKLIRSRLGKQNLGGGQLVAEGSPSIPDLVSYPKIAKASDPLHAGDTKLV